MRDYVVTDPVDYNGRKYPIGSPITLDAETAGPLLAVHSIEEPKVAERALSEVLAGSDYLPSLIRVTKDVTMKQTEIVQRAFVASGLDYAAWNGLSDDDRELRISSALELILRQHRNFYDVSGAGTELAKAEAARVERENLADDPEKVAAADVVVQQQATADGDAAAVVAGTVLPTSSETSATPAVAVAVDPVAATHTHTPQDGKATRRRT